LGRAAFADAGFAGTGFGGTGFGAAAFGTGFGMSFGIGLFGFTVTFDVERDGAGLAGARATFLGDAALWTAFLGAALPGRLAALFDFFEGM
jgi:hypothetical protein